MSNQPEDPRDPDYEGRRFASEEDAAAALPEPSLDDPVAVGILFLKALRDPGQYSNALHNLVTPESLDAWGDFSEAAKGLEAIQNPGFGSRANRAHDASDVAYVKILSNIEQSYEVTEEQVVLAAAVVTLVWRPEFGQWMVHGLGDHIRPEDLPRTSPNDAPEESPEP